MRHPDENATGFDPKHGWCVGCGKVIRTSGRMWYGAGWLGPFCSLDCTRKAQASNDVPEYVTVHQPDLPMFRIDDDRGPVVIAARDEARAIVLRSRQYGMSEEEYRQVQEPDVRTPDPTADAGLVRWEDEGDGCSPKATLMSDWCGGDSHAR